MMKKLVLAFLFLSTSAMAQDVKINYLNSNYKQVNDAHTVSVSTTIAPNNFVQALTANLDYKYWDLNDSNTDKNGVSGSLAGYYDLGSDKQFTGVSQIQLASADLFPKMTAYQELSYRAGDKKNLLLGVGVGYQKFYHQDDDAFFKIGPVYYFDKGAIGYKYGKYTDSKSTTNALFANYKVNDKLETELTYNFGNGYWDYDSRQVAGEILKQEASVKSKDLAAKVTYRPNTKIGLSTTLGRTVVTDKPSDKDILTSNNIGVGMDYQW